METLAAWLAPDDCASFIANHLGRTPYAAAGQARDALPLFDWRTVDRVLRADGALDILTVAGGRLGDVRAPRSSGEARRLMGAGVSVVVRASERHDAGLRALADSFERVLPGEGPVPLFLPPAGAHSP